MLKEEEDVIELKNQIISLKKDNTALKSENTLLKVKIRKSNEEIQKRDKQIEALLNPKRNCHMKRLVSEKGASMILYLKEENVRLENLILEKELTIKRLQHEIKMNKLYGIRIKEKKISSTSLSQNSSETDTKDSLLPCFKFTGKAQKSHTKNIGKKRMWSQSERKNEVGNNIRRVASTSSITQFEKEVRTSSKQSMTTESKALKENVQIIKTAYHTLQGRTSANGNDVIKNNENCSDLQNRINITTTHDLNDNESHCIPPHEEVKQLQNYFLEMFNEVNQLKATILQMQDTQERSFEALKRKDSNIEELLKESVSKPNCYRKSNLVKSSSDIEQNTSQKEIQTIGADEDKQSPNTTGKPPENDYQAERLKKYYKLLSNLSENIKPIISDSKLDGSTNSSVIHTENEFESENA